MTDGWISSKLTIYDNKKRYGLDLIKDKFILSFAYGKSLIHPVLLTVMLAEAWKHFYTLIFIITKYIKTCKRQSYSNNFQIVVLSNRCPKS